MSLGLSSQRFAGLMAFITLLGAFLVPVFTVLAWLVLDSMNGFVADFPRYVPPVSAWGQVAGLILATSGAVLQAYGLLGLRRTFLEAAAGRWLSIPAVLGFRRFAWVSVAMVFFSIVRESAYSMIFSWHNPPGSRVMTITFGSEQLAALFTALLLVFAAHVFAAGREVEEENRAFL